MKFGIIYANLGPSSSLDGLTQLARNAEAAGFDSLWTVEHVVYPEGYQSTYPYDPSGRMPGDGSAPLPDPLIWLTAVAARTDTILLGTGIFILPQRNPLVSAKQVASLDALSGGRVRLGVGVGWLEEEFNALGVPFEDRGARTDDYIAAMRAIWETDDASYDGRFSTFSHLTANPKPVNGTVPIIIGGHTPAAARRAGKYGDGFFPGSGDIPTLIDIARQTAADAGRDPAALEIMTGNPKLWSGDPQGGIEQLAAMGVDRAVVPSFLFWGNPAEQLAEFGETVIAAHRGN